MNGFEAYQTYLAVTNHFRQANYDFFRYNGKMKVNESSYLGRKDRYTFEKCAKRFNREDFIKYLVSNIIEDSENTWIGNMMGGKGEITYKKYVQNIEALTYNFKEDLETIYDFETDFNNVFINKSGHPLLFRLYLRKQDDMMINDFVKLLDKYPKFLYSYTNIDKAKCKKLTLEVFNEQ
jgi:hypothetical protein